LIVLTLSKLRAHANRLLIDLTNHRRDLAERLDALEAQLEEARRRADNLADALSQRPASRTLLRRLDEVEALQDRLAREIVLRQAELDYWDNFEVDDRQLEFIIERTLTALSGDDPTRARSAVYLHLEDRGEPRKAATSADPLYLSQMEIPLRRGGFKSKTGGKRNAP
jgi:hypothetical protein